MLNICNGLKIAYANDCHIKVLAMALWLSLFSSVHTGERAADLG
jgi:hypothetical protein